MSNWKLVSPAKVAANQANAQLSTGPKTEEGKARSAQNALSSIGTQSPTYPPSGAPSTQTPGQHGLSSSEVFVKPEEKDLFRQFRHDYMEELRPAGALEHELAAAVIHAAWNLRRIRTLEAGLDIADEQNEPTLDRLARYAKRFESTLLRCTRELRTLQSNRAAIPYAEVTLEAELPPLADPAKVLRTNRTQSTILMDAVNRGIRVSELNLERLLEASRARRQNEATAVGA